MVSQGPQIATVLQYRHQAGAEGSWCGRVPVRPQHPRALRPAATRPDSHTCPPPSLDEVQLRVPSLRSVAGPRHRGGRGNVCRRACRTEETEGEGYFPFRHRKFAPPFWVCRTRWPQGQEDVKLGGREGWGSHS